MHLYAVNNDIVSVCVCVCVRESFRSRHLMFSPLSARRPTNNNLPSARKIIMINQRVNVSYRRSARLNWPLIEIWWCVIKCVRGISWKSERPGRRAVTVRHKNPAKADKTVAIASSVCDDARYCTRSRVNTRETAIHNPRARPLRPLWFIVKIFKNFSPRCIHESHLTVLHLCSNGRTWQLSDASPWLSCSWITTILPYMYTYTIIKLCGHCGV